METLTSSPLVQANIAVEVKGLKLHSALRLKASSGCAQLDELFVRLVGRVFIKTVSDDSTCPRDLA